jgi:hypothetical protein
MSWSHDDVESWSRGVMESWSAPGLDGLDDLGALVAGQGEASAARVDLHGPASEG